MEHAPPQNWGKRSVSKHHQHHLSVPQQSNHRSHDHKKEQQQLSPVKKRVKESTPPSNVRRQHQQQHSSPPVQSSSSWQTLPLSQSSSSQSHHHTTTKNHQQQQQQQQQQPEHQQVSYVRQQTITIHDTPSPAVSVITISDSEDESPGKWLIIISFTHFLIKIFPRGKFKHLLILLIQCDLFSFFLFSKIIRKFAFYYSNKVAFIIL